MGLRASAVPYLEQVLNFELAPTSAAPIGVLAASCCVSALKPEADETNIVELVTTSGVEAFKRHLPQLAEHCTFRR